jgi:hypothetical protein
VGAHTHVFRQDSVGGVCVDDLGNEYIPTVISCRCGLEQEADIFTGRIIKIKKGRNGRKPKGADASGNP